MHTVAERAPVFVGRSEIGRLIEVLAGLGYEVIGPVVRDGAIIYDQIDGLKDLPAGWTDEQEAGQYRLKRRDDDALDPTTG